MKRRVWVCISLISYSVLAGMARAQGLPTPPSLPDSISIAIKGVPDATGYRDQIQQFVQGQADGLTSPDAAIQKAARDKLVAEATAGSSPSYLDIYAQAVNATANTILERKPPLRVRLNIAVIAYRVAQVAHTKSLESCVVNLINDPSEPVVLRGMQAAKPVIATVVQNRADAAGSKLLPAILPAVKAQAKSGLVASEAYHALIPDGGTPAAQLAVAEPIVLGPILDILNFRISLYSSSIPDNPSAETDVPTFLYRAYKNAAPAMQHRIVQTVVDLISVAGQQAPAAKKPELEEISQTLIYAAQVLSANLPSVSSALEPVVHLRGTSGAGVAQRSKLIFGLLQPSLPYLLPPPAVTAAAAPATSP